MYAPALPISQAGGMENSVCDRMPLGKSRRLGMGELTFFNAL